MGKDTKYIKKKTISDFSYSSVFMFYLKAMKKKKKMIENASRGKFAARFSLLNFKVLIPNTLTLLFVNKRVIVILFQLTPQHDNKHENREAI